MKRVKAACICKTPHFMLKEDTAHDYAVQPVKEEVAQYQKSLERRRILYKIVEQTQQQDGSVIIKVIKQYNAAPTGNYPA